MSSETIEVGLLVRLEAKVGKEGEMERFLRDGLALIEAEPATTTWIAFRLGPSTYGIFEGFPDEAGRAAHMANRVAAALMSSSHDLLVQPPLIESIDIIAAKRLR